VTFTSPWKTHPLPAAGDRGRGGLEALLLTEASARLTCSPSARSRRTPLLGFVSKMPLHRHPTCASGPSLLSSPPGEVSCGQDMQSLELALWGPPRLRCEPSAPVCETRTPSARAVSHDFGGLLRARGAGLLHPAADHGVHQVADSNGLVAPSCKQPDAMFPDDLQTAPIAGDAVGSGPCCARRRVGGCGRGVPVLPRCGHPSKLFPRSQLFRVTAAAALSTFLTVSQSGRSSCLAVSSSDARPVSSGPCSVSESVATVTLARAGSSMLPWACLPPCLAA